MQGQKEKEYTIERAIKLKEHQEKENENRNHVRATVQQEESSMDHVQRIGKEFGEPVHEQEVDQLSQYRNRKGSVEPMQEQERISGANAGIGKN